MHRTVYWFASAPRYPGTRKPVTLRPGNGDVGTRERNPFLAAAGGRAREILATSARFSQDLRGGHRIVASQLVLARVT